MFEISSIPLDTVLALGSKILAFLAGLAALIFVHELGHFWAAKVFNIKVNAFAVGFGPKILGFRKGETEYKIRKFLKEKLKRGSVTLSIKIDSKNRFKVNNHKIESFLKAYRDIEKKYNLKLDYSQLFSSSDLVRFSTSDKVFDNKILKAIKIATDQVMVMRLREGSDIQKEFSRYIDIAKKDLSNIKSIYSKELNKLTSKKNTSNSRIEEIEKLDVTEEIDRAKSHFNQIELSIKSKEFSGKKINFILQEINRESNTILSKFLNKKIAKYAISLKIQTEKLREQINNIL